MAVAPSKKVAVPSLSHAGGAPRVSIVMNWWLASWNRVSTIWSSELVSLRVS